MSVRRERKQNKDHWKTKLEQEKIWCGLWCSRWFQGLSINFRWRQATTRKTSSKIRPLGYDDKISVKCDLWNESYWAVFSCGAVYYVVQDWYWILNHPNKRTGAVLFLNSYVMLRVNLDFLWQARVTQLGVRKISCTFLLTCLHLQMNESHKRITSRWQDHEVNDDD